MTRTVHVGSAGALAWCLFAVLLVWCAGRVLYPVPAGYIRRAVVAPTVIALRGVYVEPLPLCACVVVPRVDCVPVRLLWR